MRLQRRHRAPEALSVAIPLVYNLRSVRERWASSVVAVLGIAGTVGGVRRDARAGARLQGHARLVGPAAERDRAAAPARTPR